MKSMKTKKFLCKIFTSAYNIKYNVKNNNPVIDPLYIIYIAGSNRANN